MAYDGVGNLSGYVLQADLHGFDRLITGLETGLDAIVELRNTVQKYARLGQAQAVQNVSGNVVTYSGGTFVINRQTGKLARSIQIYPDPSGSLLGAVIVAGANYAAAVENGTTGPVDLKPSLMGKTIPIMVRGGKKARDKAIASGDATAVERHASTGRKMETAAIIFRKVGPKSKGWIIPQQPARPFMLAMAEDIGPKFTAEIQSVFEKYLNGL